MTVENDVELRGHPFNVHVSRYWRMLTLLTLPFINRWETSKIAFIISAVALVFTAPCYNYSILNGARSYSPGRVSAFVGNVYTRRGVHVNRLADRADFAVGRAVSPVEAAVF